MLEKKQIGAVFLLSSKWVTKQWRQLNINKALGPGIANKRPVQWWSKKFFKGNESLDDEESNGQPLEVVNDQLRGLLELPLLEPQEKLLKNSRLTILWSLGF